jgi:hypothetical protein
MEYDHKYRNARKNLRKSQPRFFRPGMTIFVGEPGRDDLHQHSFLGTLVRLHGRESTITAIVRDQEDNQFQVSLENIKIIGGMA